jgi:Ca2+/Na+ antiporter
VSSIAVMDLILLVVTSLGALISARYFIEAVRDRERLNTLMAATCFFLFAVAGALYLWR